MIIGFPHKPQIHGGPGSFQRRLSCVLDKKGWQVVYPEDRILPDVILVVGGTRKLLWLYKCKKRGTKIVQRLGGINWINKITGESYKQILGSIRNKMTNAIRLHFADRVIYQTRFVQDWWHKIYGVAGSDEYVIHNAVDLNRFYPDYKNNSGKKSIICVEGNLDYTYIGVEILKALNSFLPDFSKIVYGSFEKEENQQVISQLNNINYQGHVSSDSIPEIYRMNKSVYLSLDIHAACPNSVIEALASGIPIIGFDTGALKELVPQEAGIIVPYEGDSWKLEIPNMKTLENAAKKVLSDWETYSRGARKVAEEKFNIDDMVNKYIEVLNG